MSPLIIDPALFRPEAISPETAAMNDAIEQLLAEAPTIMELGAETVRERRRDGEGALAYQPPHPRASWMEAEALDRKVPVRIIQPKAEARGVYIHIHGGGHTIGAADAQDQTLAHMADSLNMVVASVEYRLAPEHPWPAAGDDCETAAMWLKEQASKLFGTDVLMIGGESAGAHLAATTMIRLRDRHGISPFKAANLVYGVYDASLSPSCKTWGDRNLIINTPIVEWFFEQVMPSSQFSMEDRRHSEQSPLYAPVEDLCPALFTIGTLDPLVDDTILMATKWIAAGNEAELAIYPGGIHAFNQIPNFTLAEEANARSLAFLEKYLKA
ncbi:alpha/beta hydrolase [Parvularcula sp. LCG005]|uniref:alpha/beta hydrolase n=1 Tax=Parvularcula sp. LCG005 TaxID=3078805 RepID=UPI002942BD91|nr:alpha/beta hydrolase [Parvularcula sp. LCG005]WOI52639.1 alpha/beta hydrolase [Parvularcula sp. LCG005]